jgi:hypothetical protein
MKSPAQGWNLAGLVFLRLQWRMLERTVACFCAFPKVKLHAGQGTAR